ncbi:MAG: helix-turn-helix domain-containing protein [Patescibacteria group bacterium]
MLLEQYLQSIGLDDKEAKIYLAGLQLGPAAIQDLAKSSDIKRTTVYEVVESLLNKNLFTVTQKGKRKLFVAQEPDNLLLFLKQRENVLEQIMPDLEALKNTSAKKPAIRVYDGIAGLKQVYLDMIKKPGELSILAAPRPLIAKTIKEFLDHEWEPLRLKNKIKRRWVKINETGETRRNFTKEDRPEKLETIKYLPADHYPFSVGIYLYRQKTAFVSFAESELVAIVIRSPEINRTLKMIFEMYWK